MPNKVIISKHKKVLRVEDFNEMTLEERLALVDQIMSGLKFKL